MLNMQITAIARARAEMNCSQTAIRAFHKSSHLTNIDHPYAAFNEVLMPQLEICKAAFSGTAFDS